MSQLTLIPLPALETINIVTMDHHSVDLVVVYLFNRTTRLVTQRLFRITKNEIDLSSDSLGSLGMIACIESESQNGQNTK
jgi:hypothetical protein